MCLLLIVQMACRARGVFHVTVPAPPKVSIFKNASESMPQVSVMEDSTGSQSFIISLPPEAFQQKTSQGVIQKTCAEILSVTSSDETMVLSSSITMTDVAGGCQISFTPNPNASGDLKFIAISILSPTDELYIPISIKPINDPPFIADISPVTSGEDVETAIPITIIDDSLGLTCADMISAVSSNETLLPNLNITISGTFPHCQIIYLPSLNLSGRTDIIATITDGKAPVIKTISVAVTAINDPPVISAVSDQIATEDLALESVIVSISDVETSLNCTDVAPTSSNLILIPSGNITLSGTAANCLIRMMPAPNQNGTSTITLTITDGSLPATDNFLLTVNPVNDSPTDLAISNTNLAENALANSVVGNLSAIDPDAGDIFTYSLVPGTGITDNASFDISGNQLRLIASADFETKSSYSILLRATDQGGLFFEKQLTITISDVNEAPSLAAIANQTTNQDTPTVPIALTITDVDGPAGTCNSTYLSYTSQTTSVVAATGAVLWSGTWPNCTAVITPVSSATGSSVLAISVSDGSLTSLPASFTVNVSFSLGWYQEAYIKASNANSSDWFGSSIAISGDTAIVGGSEEDSNQTFITNGTTSGLDNTAAQAGAAYIYKRTESLWAQEAYLKASNAEASDRFGTAVSISGDTAIVGADLEDSNQTTITNGTVSSPDNNAPSAGASYIYRRYGDVVSGYSWVQEAYLKASNINNIDQFGYAVSISGDTAIVGAYLEDSNQTTITNGATSSPDNTSIGAGASYIYRRSGSSWAQEAYLKASNAQSVDNFGSAIAISADTAIVGAKAEDSSQTIITNGTASSLNNAALEAGASYIYRRNGSIWSQEAYVKASNANANDGFASSVSISGDTAIVGAYLEDSNQTFITNGATSSTDNILLSAGASYIYKRTGNMWSQEAFLKASNADVSDSFGSSVAVSGDTTIVGATGEASSQTVITNGTTSSLIDNGVGIGASYVYRRIGTTWTQEAYVKASHARSSMQFGNSVSLSGDTAIVGAYQEGSNQTIITNGTTSNVNNLSLYSGAVFVYRNLSRMFEAHEVASSATTSSFTLRWNGSNLGTGLGSVKVVYSTTTPGPNCSSGTVAYTGSATSVSVTTGLTPGQSYVARICTFDGANYSEGVTTGLTVKGDDIGPIVLSITRGTTPNPVPWGTSQIDYIVTFDEPVVNLNPENFSLTEVTTNTGVTGQISSVSCSGAVCTVWVLPGMPGGLPGTIGQLRLDLTNTLNVLDQWFNPLAAAKNGDETYSLPSGWYQEAYLKASNPDNSDFFGQEVSISGDTAIVGAFGEDSNQTVITNGTGSSLDNSLSSSGACYIYKRNGSSWVQEAYLKASNAEVGDGFGSSVSISGDTAIVGGSGEDSSQMAITNGTSSSLDNTFSNAGASYIYKRSGSIWNQEAYIKASNADVSDSFGIAVALSGDTAIVGANWERSNQTVITNGPGAILDNNFSTAVGASYIYKRTGAIWAQEAYVKASNAGANDLFGSSVSLAGDTAIVGAYYEGSNQTVISNGTTSSLDNSFSYAGASYVYRRNGSSWVQEAYLKAANANASDSFGDVVALAGDTVIVGAQGEDSNLTVITNGTTSSLNNTVSNSGASYIYKRTGSLWAQEAYLKASNAQSSAVFGTSVSVSGDTAIVGAIYEASNQTVITNGSTSSLNNTFSQAGAGYIYKRTGTNWIQEAYLKASNAQAGDNFGSAMAISADTAIVGALREDSNQTTITNGIGSSLDNTLFDSGAVYVYRSLSRIFDPDLRVSGKDQTTITLSWGGNLGSATGVKIAPAIIGDADPLPCSDPSAITLAPSVTSYTYSGLTSGTKYAFRVCGFDGMNVGEGAIIRDDTD